MAYDNPKNGHTLVPGAITGHGSEAKFFTVHKVSFYLGLVKPPTEMAPLNKN